MKPIADLIDVTHGLEFRMVDAESRLTDAEAIISKHEARIATLEREIGARRD